MERFAADIASTDSGKSSAVFLRFRSLTGLWFDLVIG
jgi:hypothetical protein